MKRHKEDIKQPTILRYTQEKYSGVLSHTYTRDVVGYVVRGSKRIYYGNTGYEVHEGDIFFLSPGHYHIEDIPRNGISE